MCGSRRNLAVLAAVGLCAAFIGCARPGPRDGGAAGGKADKARKDAEALALAAVNGAATAQAKAVPETAVRRDITWLGGRVTINRDTWRVSVGSAKNQPKAHDSKTAGTKPEPAGKPRLPVRPGSPVVLYEHVSSSLPYPTEAEAEEDALEQARDAIERRLGELDPPVRHKPSVAEVRAEFVRADGRTFRAPDGVEKELLAREGLTTELVYAEVDVEVTADQVRELRSRGRLLPVTRVLGGLFAVALAGFLFLRANEWTKGTKTLGLALGATAIAGAGIAAAVLV